MSKALLLCRILGDGQTPDTAYRAAIADVVDPADPTGPKPFITRAVIGSDPDTGAPLHDWCIAVADGVKHSLYRNNPDIDALPPTALLSLRLSALGQTERTQMFDRITARGINVSNFSMANSYRDLVTHLLNMHQPGFPVEDLDVES